MRLHPGIALLAVVVGCGERPRQADSVAAAPPAVVAVADSSPGRPACPATGLWSRCAIVERLDRSGLAPRVDSTAEVTEPPLAARGFLVRLGRSELEVYLFDDAAARARAQAALDSSKYVAYNAPLTMEQQPTLIVSANALAILHSRNDHQRERVGDAITAGAPGRAP